MKLPRFITACVTCLSLLTAQAYAIIVVEFDFENHTAGDALGGPVGTARSTSTSTHGDAFDYTASAIAANVTVSTLQEGGPTNFNSTAANVRSDTVGGAIAGDFSGNFLELNPFRVPNGAFSDVLDPNNSTTDYLFFSVQADSGYKLSLNSFSYDRGIGEGASDSSMITFRAKPWYSLDGGNSWTNIAGLTSISTNGGGDLSANFVAESKFFNLTGVGALQDVTGEVVIALSMNDNTGRSLYSSTSQQPYGFYLDNIWLAADVTAVPEANSFVAVSLVFALVGSISRRRQV